MPTSLIPEKPLVISPSLAATIGLEEAVMLQGLHEAMLYFKADIKDGFKWHQFEKRELEQRFPFWQPGDIQRIANNLKEKGVVVLGEESYLTSNNLLLALNEKVVAAVTGTLSDVAALPTPEIKPQPSTPKSPISTPTVRASTSTAGRPHPTTGRYKMYPQWQVDKEIIKQIKKLGIPPSFIDDTLPEFIQYWVERDEAHHGWGSKFRSWISRQWREQETLFAGKLRATEMPNEWYPDIDAIEILQRAGVSKDFIEDAIPEFVLYWRERGDSTSTWNSKFVQHIRLQWARYTHTIENDVEPKVIPEDWQPAPEVFEILHMANINADFARSLIPEFVLYWRETNQMQRSWNSKFLQHTKFHWAKRHDLAKGGKEGIGFIERHQDKSWADGL